VSVTQLDRSMRSVAALTTEATDLSRRATRDAEEGGTAVQRSLEGLGRVRTQMSESATVVKEVGRRTGEISTIVDTINLIAERTNLLSLNASIEAARAGDAGRGFAVVAEEIRNLADRSAKATADIAAIIRGLQAVVQDAVSATVEGQRVAEETGRLSEEGAAGLKRIISGIELSSQKIAQIAGATQEQLGATAQLVTGVGSVTAQVRQVSTATAEQAKAMQSLVRHTAQMRSAARQVTQAMDDQSRSAREIVKAAESSASLAAQVRRAMGEQATAAAETMAAVEVIRRGAASTSRAMGEQTRAVESVTREAESFRRMSVSVATAMEEQANAVGQIAQSAEDMRRHSINTSKGLAEQSRAATEISEATHNVARQIALMVRANREQSENATVNLETLAELRRLGERAAEEVRATGVAPAVASLMAERSRRAQASGQGMTDQR
jgi:methyl-accepting chemotaxis protein